MAGNCSNYLEDKLLKHVLTNTTYTPPATVYCALSTTTPNDAGSVTEPSTGAYVRMAMAFSVSGTAPTQASNSSTVTWPTATASWGTITHAVLYDASTSGNMLYWLPLVDPADFITPLSRTVSSGDIFKINSGDLRVRCD